MIVSDICSISLTRLKKCTASLNHAQCVSQIVTHTLKLLKQYGTKIHFTFDILNSQGRNAKYCVGVVCEEQS